MIKDLRDIFLALAAAVIFILFGSLVYIILSQPQPPCPTHYVETLVLGTDTCVAGKQS